MDNPPVDWSVRDHSLTTPPVPVPVAQPVGPPLPAYPPLGGAPRRRSRTGLLAGLITAVTVVLLGAGIIVVLTWTGRSSLPLPITPSTMTVTGTLQIFGGCSGFGYDDIHSGTQVVITDESGAVLAVGELTSSGTPCSWSFAVTDVPTGKHFYGVTISHRGTIQYTETQLRAGVSLSLGD